MSLRFWNCLEMSDAMYARSGMSGLRMDFVGIWGFLKAYTMRILWQIGPTTKCFHLYTYTISTRQYHLVALGSLCKVPRSLYSNFLHKSKIGHL